MIIGYSTSPNLTTEERLRSLRDSVQRALDEAEDNSNSVDSRVKKLESEIAVLSSEVISEAFTTSGYENVSVPVKKISGYTPYIMHATMAAAGSHYGYCNIYNVRVDNGVAKCGVRVVDGGTATDVKVKFSILYIANKTL